MAHEKEDKMMRAAKKIALSIIKKRKLEIVTRARLEYLELYEKRLERLSELVNLKINQEVLHEVLTMSLKNSSQSQLMQDILALYFNDSNLNRYEKFFVEFGATDGKTLSNTYLLEKDFDWKGILVEPAKIWHQRLLTTRRCQIDTRAVSEHSGEKVSFLENKVGELSTIYDGSKVRSTKSPDNGQYLVETISLVDLLDSISAPRNIGYLSVDTEGNEYDILRSFNFEKYKFGFISVEHNFLDNRQNIFELLTTEGYTRVLVEFSKWDDFYLPNEHPFVKLY